MAKKPYRPKLIGDPLKKFKQKMHKGQDIPQPMREYLEQAMEQDHRAGFPLRAAMFTSSRSGMPDRWFFDKARTLGYIIEDEQEFFHTNMKDCFKDQERIPQYVQDFEHFLRIFYPPAEIAKMYGSIEQFRITLDETLRQAQTKGKSVSFGTNTSFITNRSESRAFLTDESTTINIRRSAIRSSKKKT